MSVGAGVNERLAALTAAGTSVWLDQIRRSIITSGELARLRDELSLRGETSNPAIFEKAILGGNEYDEFIGQLAREGKDATERTSRSLPSAWRRSSPLMYACATST